MDKDLVELLIDGPIVAFMVWALWRGIKRLRGTSLRSIKKDRSADSSAPPL